MSAKVTYNNQHLRPVSSINVDVNIERTENCDVLDVNYSISIEGYILAQHGSPQTDGTFGPFDGDVCENIPYSGWTNAIGKKYCHIQDLFADDFKELCWGNEGYSDNLSAYPKLIGFSLDSNDNNPQYQRYSIELEADNIYCGGVGLRPSGLDCIKSFDESWDFSYERSAGSMIDGDNRIFQVSHEISAAGRPKIVNGVVTKTAAECAKEFICERISNGGDLAPPDSCTLPVDYTIASYKKRNYSDSHSIDTVNGNYSVSEQWVYTSGDYTDSYSMSVSDSDQDGCKTTNLTGTITGYDCRTSGVVTDSGFNFAKSQYERMASTSGFHTRAVNITGLNLDYRSESSTISYSPFGGTVDYDYNYKERPNQKISDAKFESIAISNNWDEDVTYTVSLLDKGEVVGKINGTSYKALKTSLTIDLIFDCGFITNPYGPRFDSVGGDIQTLVDTYNPGLFISSGGLGQPIFENVVVSSQNESWNENTGSYNYSIEWIYNYDGTC